jgi:hypothetical protein
MAYMVKHLPSKLKALSSNFSTTKNQSINKNVKILSEKASEPAEGFFKRN